MVMQSTWDELKKEFGPELLGAVEVRTQTEGKSSRKVFTLQPLDVISLFPCTGELFLVEQIRASTTARAPR